VWFPGRLRWNLLYRDAAARLPPTNDAPTSVAAPPVSSTAIAASVAATSLAPRALAASPVSSTAILAAAISPTAVPVRLLSGREELGRRAEQLPGGRNESCRHSVGSGQHCAAAARRRIPKRRQPDSVDRP